MRSLLATAILAVSIVTAQPYWPIPLDYRSPSPVGSVSATVQNSTQGYQSFDYEESSENVLKQIRLTIPKDLTTVRGLLVVSNPAGGDTRGWFSQIWYAEFLQLHGFAFLGMKGFNSHSDSVQVMQHALRQFAQDAHHPELINVPYATTGFSAGGGFASRLLVEMPDRVIASVPVCSRLNFTGIAPSAALLHTPACVITGELEKIEAMIQPVLAACRPEGAQYSWMTVQGSGHAMCGQELLAMPLLDAAVRLRYPTEGDVRKGPLTLRTLDIEQGWVADNNTWKSGITSITPAKGFKGDIAQSSWLPTKDIAFIYRAYSTYDRKVTLTVSGSGGNRLWEPGSSITLSVDETKAPGSRKLEFYDGANLLGEISHGPSQFTQRNLTPGYHVFSALITDAEGKMQTSNPVMVVGKGTGVHQHGYTTKSYDDQVAVF